jgi:hypothetical protein
MPKRTPPDPAELAAQTERFREHLDKFIRATEEMVDAIEDCRTTFVTPSVIRSKLRSTGPRNP